MPTSRVCIDCHRVRAASPCTDCARARGPRAKRPTNATLTAAERQRRAAVVAAHRVEHGDWCPGYEREAHEVLGSNILTADHVVAVANGGGQGGHLTVLCRACNSSKQAR